MESLRCPNTTVLSLKRPELSGPRWANALVAIMTPELSSCVVGPSNLNKPAMPHTICYLRCAGPLNRLDALNSSIGAHLHLVMCFQCSWLGASFSASNPGVL